MPGLRPEAAAAIAHSKSLNSRKNFHDGAVAGHLHSNDCRFVFNNFRGNHREIRLASIVLLQQARQFVGWQVLPSLSVKEPSPMNRISLVLAIAVALGFSAGCTSKKYVRQQTTPIINKTNELDEMTARNTNAIRDVDTRAQQGIQGVNQKATLADQKAATADQNATQAQQMASQLATRADQIESTVANLDQFKTVVETDVHFAFNSDALSKKAKEALDELATSVGSAQHFIITVEGGADSVGSKEYNYDLSQRRAQAVIQYLAGKANIPAHQIYLIGLGKDHPVADNSSNSGRARNRRVEVRLMTNREAEGTTAANQPTGPAQR